MPRIISNFFFLHPCISCLMIPKLAQGYLCFPFQARKKLYILNVYNSVCLRIRIYPRKHHHCQSRNCVHHIPNFRPALFIIFISIICVVCVQVSICSVMSDSAVTQPLANKAPLPMGFSQQEYQRVGCHFLLQGIFLPKGSKPRLLYLLHCKQILYHWAAGDLPS